MNGLRYNRCMLCPRRCAVERTEGKRGFCGETDKLRLSSALMHYGEEPSITGEGGSGTLFFPGCTLKCFSCQNYQISREGIGREITIEELSRICLKLEEEGAQNINIVTGSHFIPSIKEALSMAKEKGLDVPIVWNSSAFERLEALEEIDPLIDIYLPDLKTLRAGLAKSLFTAPDYPKIAREAILFMIDRHRLECKEGLLKSGVIVRHLLLPGLLDSSREVISWFAAHCKDRALFSLMFQYRPTKWMTGQAENLSRRLFPREEEEILSWLFQEGVEEGYVQEHGAEDEEEWCPDFSKEKPFRSKKSRVIWSSSNS